MRIILIAFIDGEWRFRFGSQWCHPGPLLSVGAGRAWSQPNDVRHVTADSAREDYGMRFKTLRHVGHQRNY